MAERGRDRGRALEERADGRVHRDAVESTGGPLDTEDRDELAAAVQDGSGDRR